MDAFGIFGEEDNEMIDERELAYILQVAEERTFSQAAKKLYVTQPSLSQCIKRVENELGTELLTAGQIR